MSGPAVLIADDESLLRRLMKRVLEASGLRVEAVGDGDEALAALAAAPDEIAVVVLDLSMPPYGGLETMQRLLEIRPDVGVVITSGLPPEAAMDEFLARHRAIFLQKPFAPEALRRAVHDRLARRCR